MHFFGSLGHVLTRGFALGVAHFAVCIFLDSLGLFLGGGCSRKKKSTAQSSVS